MVSNAKLAQMLKQPQAWQGVEMLESEFRDVVFWIVEYLARPSEAAEIVQEIIACWEEKNGPGPGR